MEKRNFHWLVGDRFVCVFRKNVLIDEITSCDVKWSVKTFTAETSNEFVSTINEGSLFDIGNTLYIHDGTIPEQAKSVPFIEKLSAKKHLIVIEGSGGLSKIDKRTVTYKKYKDIAEYFEPVIQPSGFPDKKLIPFAKIVLKNMLSMEVQEYILDHVFESCGYDYGRTVNELEKCFIWAGKEIESIKHITPILNSEEPPTIEKSVNALNACDFEKTFTETNNLFEKKDGKKIFMNWAGMLAESFTFILHCRTAIDLGCSSPDEIGQFVSERFIKKEKPIDAYSATKRYYVHQNNVKKFTSKRIGLILGILERSMSDFIYKSLPPRYLANDIILQAAQLHYQNV